MSYPVFKESQNFRQWWIWVIFGLSLLWVGWGIIRQVFMGIPWGSKPSPDWGLWALLGFILLLALFFYLLQLDTRIDNQGIRYRFSPLLMRERAIAWKEVESAAVRKYRPIFEYGGWGLRYGFRGGWAYNVSGCMGLQLLLKSGKKILIGTQKPAEMEQVLKDLERIPIPPKP